MLWNWFETTSRFVVFRSAKERPFAERKATVVSIHILWSPRGWSGCRRISLGSRSFCRSRDGSLHSWGSGLFSTGASRAACTCSAGASTALGSSAKAAAARWPKLFRRDCAIAVSVE